MATDPAEARRGDPGRWPWRVAAGPRNPAHLALLVLICAGLAAYAWVDARAAPFSRGALAGVVVPGALLAFIALARPPQRIPAPEQLDAIGMSYWMICLAVFFEWEASAWRDSSFPWHPSFTNLLLPLLVPHLVKTAAIIVWLLAGWGLVRR